MALQGKPVNLDLLRRTTRADFYAQIGVSEQESIYNQVTMPIDSDSDQETYAFFGSISKPNRADVAGGGGVIKEATALLDYSQTLVNATWTMDTEVRRDIIEDAKLDMIGARARTMADRGVAWFDERFTVVFEANGAAYDGVAFYSTVHHGGSGSAKDNTTTSAAATGVIPNVTEFEDGFALALGRIRVLTDDRGGIANTGNLGLVAMVDPTNERVARSVLETGPVAGQTGNSGVFKGFAKVLVNPYLTSAAGDRMFLFVTSKPIRPIVYQTRIPWEFNFKTDGDDWDIRDVGHLLARARFDFLLADWKKSVRHIWT